MADDLLKEFINESREHLATIEADLLTVEEGGADVDEALVNKVFRAAHSIKGGSGFFGLNKVKQLAHGAETILDMLRSRKMVPSAEVTNVLLAAFDKLREMINNATASEDEDIDDLVASLASLASSYLPSAEKSVLKENVTLQAQEEMPAVTLPKIDFERARLAGQYIYQVDYDLIHDIERRDKNVLTVFHDLEATGDILDCALDFEAVGTLDSPIGNRLPLRVIFATIIDPAIIDTLFNIEHERIGLLLDPHADLKSEDETPAVSPAGKPAPAPAQGQASHPTGTKAPTPPKPPAKEIQKKTPPPVSSNVGPTQVDETLRVNVSLLETLMNLAGELVLSRNQLRSAVAQNNMQSLSTANQRISQVTAELQDVIMQTRLQPIGNVFSKFPRVVRDLSMSLGKDIQLDIRGKEVALDKSLVEGLSDPLTHMVRNAVDHGIESAEERQRAGKKPAGQVRIEARHEAGQVVVEIEDDGKGIDPKQVADSAIGKGLISAEKVQGMSDQDKQALIFLPGLSTSVSVSEISGRGVGMDVVKTNLDRLGGKIEITSEVGKGSLFRIKLPLTLAIIPSLIVSVEGERFAIPQINIEELLRLRAEDVKHRIEVVGNSDVLLLRDRVLPLVRFDRILGVTPTYNDPNTGRDEIDRRVNLADRRSPRQPVQASGDNASSDPSSSPADAKITPRKAKDRRKEVGGALEIAVVTTGTLSYGLVVGAFHDTEEIVVKPLGSLLKGLREYAGATILGDGTVALILDITGLAAKTDLISVSGSARAAELAAKAERDRLQDRHALLLFHNGPDEPCAIALETVQRIERISPEHVERRGGRLTMQYRNTSLPLVTLADTAKVSSLDNVEDLAVLVSSVHGREVGLLGAMPVDVIETKASIDQTTHRQKGIAGSAIIEDQTTLIADLFELVDAVYPEWHGGRRAAGSDARRNAPSAQKITVLLAEDSDFFRAQLKRFLEEDGFAVLDAPDGEVAWQLLLENANKVQVVVTDIEMPQLTGLELAQRIRADQRTARLPIIAVTSLAEDDDIARGKAVGINDYQIKLDRDQLLAGVRAAAVGGPVAATV